VITIPRANRQPGAKNCGGLLPERHGHFHPRRHLMTSRSYRAIRTQAFHIWRQETCPQHVARPTLQIIPSIELGLRKLT
jgi:hypothetical protein